MSAPPGYDPTVSSLPDPGAAAAPMKAMMGGAAALTGVGISPSSIMSPGISISQSNMTNPSPIANANTNADTNTIPSTSHSTGEPEDEDEDDDAPAPSFFGMIDTDDIESSSNSSSNSSNNNSNSRSNNSNNYRSTPKTDRTTVTILGEPYRIRSQIHTEPYEVDEERLLQEAFRIGPTQKRSLGPELLGKFFHALATYNCEREEGVLLNPKCEPVRAVLRASLMSDFVKNINERRANRNLGPLRGLTETDALKRRNTMNVAVNIEPKSDSFLDRLLKSKELRERIHMKPLQEMDAPLEQLILATGV